MKSSIQKLPDMLLRFSVKLPYCFHLVSQCYYFALCLKFYLMRTLENGLLHLFSKVKVCIDTIILFSKILNYQSFNRQRAKLLRTYLRSKSYKIVRSICCRMLHRSALFSYSVVNLKTTGFKVQRRFSYIETTQTGYYFISK